MMQHLDAAIRVATMRTTIDLPEDLHKIATSIARDQGTSLSETVAQLMRRGLGDGPSLTPYFSISPVTGLSVLHLGRVITSEDVRALEDDE